MTGNVLFIAMLLLWTFVGGGINAPTLTGVLNGRVELQGHYNCGSSVEWEKYTAGNFSKRLIYKCDTTMGRDHCQNVSFNSRDMRLILNNLTKNDEGIYEETVVFNNNTIQRFNMTLSVIASGITVSSSPRGSSLTLNCRIGAGFKRWFKNGRALQEDHRFNFSENNETVQVSNPNASDCGTYTCQVWTESGISVEQVNVNDKILSLCLRNTSGSYAQTKHLLFPAGFSLVGLLVLCVVFSCIFKFYARRKIPTTSLEEPISIEPMSLQEEAATLTVKPLIVYQDFIKPKDLHQLDQSEDFGYSTIADVLETIQASGERT